MMDSLINSFDIWTKAQGVKSKGRVKNIDNISLEGIARLRELILKFALEGKLTIQDSNEEPAIELLKRIDQQRDYKIPSFILDTSNIFSPYTLPLGWEWVRLQRIIQISSGDSLTTSQMNNDGNIPVFGGNGINGYHDKANISKPTIVIGRVGFYCGSIHITPTKAWVTDNAFITTFSEENIDLNFLSWLLKGTNLKENESATAQPVISGRKIYPIIVGLPPLEEQKRIVAKVNELMALCDKLEEVQTNNLSTHHHLVKSLLATLTQANDADELQTAWDKLALHFDTLFCTEDSIEQLKQTILQLAVMGKLVKQDPNDEPASELLKQIAKEKERLVDCGEIKKQSSLPEIRSKDIPSGIPFGWSMSRLGTFTIVGTGSTPARDRSDYYSPAEISWVTSGETGNDFIYQTVEKISQLAVQQTNISIYPKGSLIVAMYGQGKTRGQVSELMIDAGTNQACAAIVFLNKDDYHRKYLKFFFKKSYEEIRSNAEGGAQPNLNLGKIANTVIPLPPLSEQKRIVEKVSELLLLCETLKNKISITRNIQSTLAQTVITSIN